MDLDRDDAPYNTAETRGAAVNAPAWTWSLTLRGFPGGPPARIAAWLQGALVCLDQMTSRGSSPPRSPGGLSLALWGAVGSGKTGLGVCSLCALAEASAGSRFYWNMATGPGLRAAVAAGDAPRRPAPCWFESWPRLLALQRRVRWDEEEWFDQLEERVAVLMLDDVGVVAGTPFREALLLRHLEWAAEVDGRVLILTLNDPPASWPRVLGERVADRLVDPVRFVVVEVPGPSLR